MANRLNKREREIFAWIAEGKTAGEIGTILGISRRTVEWHIRMARAKISANNVVQAIAMAVRAGVIGTVTLGGLTHACATLSMQTEGSYLEGMIDRSEVERS